MFNTFLATICTIFVLVSGISENEYSKELMDIFGLNTDNIPSLELIHRGNKSYYIGDIFKGNVLHCEQFCRYHGMNLLTIESQAENDFLENILLERGNTNDWFITSGSRIPSNKWVWLSTGRNLVYSNWNPGEPNNVVKEEQCIAVNVVNKQLKWYDIHCWQTFYFICQVSWKNNDRKILEILKNKANCQNSSKFPDDKFQTPKIN